jgi:hypothetical protein
LQRNAVRDGHVYGRYNADINTRRLNAERSLVATLARIDEQIVESDALLLKLPTGGALLRVTDELAYLRIQRRGVAAELQRNR